MAVKTRGCRRADAPVKTPLTELTDALAANSGAVGRRAAVVAAAGGLMAAVVLPTANSATEADGKVVAQDSAAENAPKFENQASLTAPEAKVDAIKTSTAAVDNVSAAKAPEKEKEKPKAPASDSGSSSRDSGPASRGAARGGSDDVELPDGSKAQQVIGLAKQYVGTPYVSGGTTPNGWDCSGFTSYVFGKVGVNLPRTSGAQRSAGSTVSQSAAKPGDIIWSPGHVGIYAGGGMMYDAGNPRVGTSYRSIDWMVKKGAVFIRVL